MKRLAAIVLSFIAVGPVFADGFGSSTFAFYPFRERPAGESAVGVTITNLIDEAKFPGAVTKVGDGDVVYSDEHPGRYLFEKFAYGPAIAYENPGSLYFPNTSSTGNHAKVFFDGIARKLNQLVIDHGSSNDAWKVEFYVKFDSGCYKGNSTTEGVQPDICKLVSACDVCNSSSQISYTNCDFHVRPYDNGGAYRFRPYCTGYNVSNGAPGSSCGNNTYSDSTIQIKNGKWHYISFSSGYNNFGFAGKINHSAEGNNFRLARFNNDTYRPRFRVVDPDRVCPLVFNNNGVFRGWISCLRMTTSGITSGNDMFASDLETCAPRAYTHLRMEGTAGDNVASNTTLVSAVKFSDFSTNITCSGSVSGSACGSAYGNGRFSQYGEPSVDDFYTNSVPRKFVAEGGVEKEDALADRTSLGLVTPIPSTTTARLQGYDIRLKFNDTLANLQTNDAHTIEFFARFDYEDWIKRVGENTENSRLVQLFWTTWADTDTGGSYPYNLSLTINLTGARPKLQLCGYAGSSTVEVPELTDGKWHHYALVLHPENRGARDEADYRLYFDHRLVGEGLIYYYKNYNYQIKRYIHFCRGVTVSTRGGESFPFHGAVDEIRISGGELQPSEMLYARGFDPLQLLLK